MNKKIILIFIFLIAFILRFWDLGSNPPSLDWDEASLGYNAYSILKTGKDEYGNFLPLSIRSFGDYKPPLYTYLTTIPVAIFGLNEFSTRFISALFGTFTVIVGYFLVKQLFPNKSPTFYLLSFTWRSARSECTFVQKRGSSSPKKPLSCLPCFGLLRQGWVHILKRGTLV